MSDCACAPSNLQNWKSIQIATGMTMSIAMGLIMGWLQKNAKIVAVRIAGKIFFGSGGVISFLSKELPLS
jgi:hypothetical protein